MSHAAPIRRKHMSGRYTATPTQEVHAVTHYLANCDFWTTTEIDAWARSQALKVKGFHHVFGNKGSRDDTGMAISEARFDVRESGTKTLSPLTYITESHGRSDTTEGSYSVVRDRLTGEVGVTVVVHMPHGMQEQLRHSHYNTDVARAYRGILVGARKLANGLAHNYKADWTEIVGDWNLNIKQPWVQHYLRFQFPTYRVNFAAPFPARGTFHDEIIDLSMLRGAHPVRNPVILPPEPGFDHGGWLMDMETAS